MMKASGQAGAALRELAGEITEDNLPAFNPDDIEKMFKLLPFIVQRPQKHLFVTADPSGGGTSHLAIVSGFLITGDMHPVLVVSFFCAIFSIRQHRFDQYVFFQGSCLFPQVFHQRRNVRLVEKSRFAF